MARMVSRQEAAAILDVDVQTISNWIEKGALTGHHVYSKRQGKDIVMVDKQSIIQYFDTLSELGMMENKVSSLKETLKEQQLSLEQKISDVSRANYLFDNGLPKYLLESIFRCVLEVAGENLLCERERSMLHKLVLCKYPVSDLAEEYGLSSSRIMQIFHRAVSKISSMQSWPTFHREYKRLQHDNRNLSVLVDNQQSYIKQLEAQLNIKKELGDDSESPIVGYSKKQLAEVLSRRLVNENLSIRTLNCLKWVDVETVNQLIRMKEIDLLRLRNFGKKSLREIKNFLSSIGLSLGMNLSDLVDTQVEHYLETKKI